MGGVTVFGLPADLSFYTNAALKTQPYVIVGSGNRTSKVRLSPDELSNDSELLFHRRSIGYLSS